MDKTQVTKILNPIIAKPDCCGFEAYILLPDNPRLKRLKLSNNGLHQKIKEMMINVIHEKYLLEDAVYSDAENVADNQAIFYVIQQTDEYKPFNMDAWLVEEFSEDDLSSFMGFLFKFRYEQQEVWCYQNKRSITVPNRKKANVIARFKRFDTGYWFEEQDYEAVTFAKAIDILIIDDIIITSDIKLVERSFGFQAFIQQKAQQAVQRITGTELFSGVEKLNEYIASEVKSHKSYLKKMMKAIDSPVLQMQPSDLFAKVSTLPRWRNKFKEPMNGKIPIVTNKEIESLIDLLIERYTVSEVSGQEYDTEVKKKAESIKD